MTEPVALRDPGQLRAYAAGLAEVRTALGGISALTHTSLNGALTPIDEQSYPRATYPPANLSGEYGQYAQGYTTRLPYSGGWSILSYIKTQFESLALADDSLVASLTRVAGSADRTVAAQVHVATAAAGGLPDTDAGGGAALAAAVASVPPPPAEPAPDPRFVPRSGNRPR